MNKKLSLHCTYKIPVQIRVTYTKILYFSYRKVEKKMKKKEKMDLRCHCDRVYFDINNKQIDTHHNLRRHQDNGSVFYIN